MSALFLFALTTMGFAPGPFMLERNANVVYSIIWVLSIASVIGVGLLQPARPARGGLFKGVFKVLWAEGVLFGR